MKVIHFIAGIDKNAGGTTEYMRLVSTALKDKVSLIIATGNSDSPVVIEGVTIKFFDTKIANWFTMCKQFKTFLLEENPEIVHINGIWSPENWGFQKMAQELGIKVVLSPHGMLEPWILANNPWKKKVALFLYQNKALVRADYLHATAQMELESIKKLGYQNKIMIIPNGIDQSEVKETKTEYGSKKMIFLSRIHPKKGIDLLLEAWKNAATAGWKLEIAGTGDFDYLETLQSQALELNNVTFVGPVYGEEKWKFLKSADVMVLPTHSENFGIVVAEALAVGLPVITTTGTPWIDLSHFNCGWWIDLSTSNLEKAISTAINSSPIVIQEMGSRGQFLVKEKYEMKSIALQMVALYKTVLT